MNKYIVTTRETENRVIFADITRINENGDLMFFQITENKLHEMTRAFARFEWAQFVLMERDADTEGDE